MHRARDKTVAPEPARRPAYLDDPKAGDSPADIRLKGMAAGLAFVRNKTGESVRDESNRRYAADARYRTSVPATRQSIGPRNVTEGNFGGTDFGGAQSLTSSSY
jgi:hypothetical protein